MTVNSLSSIRENLEQPLGEANLDGIVAGRLLQVRKSLDALPSYSLEKTNENLAELRRIKATAGQLTAKANPSTIEFFGKLQRTFAKTTSQQAQSDLDTVLDYHIGEMEVNVKLIDAGKMVLPKGFQFKDGPKTEEQVITALSKDSSLAKAFLACAKVDEKWNHWYPDFMMHVIQARISEITEDPNAVLAFLNESILASDGGLKDLAQHFLNRKVFIDILLQHMESKAMNGRYTAAQAAAMVKALEKQDKESLAKYNVMVEFGTSGQVHMSGEIRETSREINRIVLAAMSPHFHSVLDREQEFRQAIEIDLHAFDILYAFAAYGEVYKVRPSSDPDFVIMLIRTALKLGMNDFVKQALTPSLMTFGKSFHHVVEKDPKSFFLLAMKYELKEVRDYALELMSASSFPFFPKGVLYANNFSAVHIKYRDLHKLGKEELDKLNEGLKLFERMGIAVINDENIETVEEAQKALEALPNLPVGLSYSLMAKVDPKFAEWAAKVPGITSLTFERCGRVSVTDPVMETVANSFPRLAHLTIKAPFDIGPGAFENLAKKCPRLSSIMLDDMRDSGDAALVYLASTLPQVTAITLTGAHGVTTEGIAQAKAINPKLNVYLQ